MKKISTFIIKKLFLLLIVYGIATSAKASSGNYDEDDYDESYPSNSSSRSPEWHGDSDIELEQSINEKLRKVIETNREALDVLFRSDEKAKQLVVDRVEREIPKGLYWHLDDALYFIEEEIISWGGSLDKNTQQQIKDVQMVIREKMADLLVDPRYNKTFHQLNSTTKTIDCAIGRHSRNDHFFEIEDSTYGSIWVCKKSMPALWKDLIAADYSNKSCTFNESLSALVSIEQAWNIPTSTEALNEKRFVIRFQFLKLISTERYKTFLMPLLCDSSVQSCPIYDDVLCESDFYNMAARITKKFDSKAKTGNLSDYNSLMTTLELMTTLTNITKQITTSFSHLRDAEMQKAAQNMLVYYLGIINVAFGKNTTGAWKQLTISRAIEQFEQFLVSNDDYIGFAAEMILAQEKSVTEYNETSISVYLKKLPSSSAENNNRVEFNFGNVRIWTNNLTYPNNSGVNAYAVHYNSWSNVLRHINDSSQLIAGGNTSGNRWFIGNGDVISFTSKMNQKKLSVPVYYRINFDGMKVFRDEDGNVASRCLSCGYYDIVSQTWSSNGCHVDSADDVSVTCFCNHTTNFAAFMSPYEREYNLTESENLWLNIFEYVGSITSVVGLTLSFIAFYIVRNAVRNDRLRAHMNLVAALLGVNLIQIGADFAITNNTLCVVTTVATHYFLLASFMWMLVEGVFLYFYVVHVFVRSKTENQKWMYFTGWLVPLIIVAISAGYGIPNEQYVQPRSASKAFYRCEEGQLLYPAVAEELKYSSCWLSSKSGMTWSFVGPAIAVILLNMMILCKVISALAKLSDRRSRSSRTSQSESSSNSCRRKSEGIPQLLSYKTASYEIRNDGSVNWFNNNDDGFSSKPSSPSNSFKQYSDTFSVLTFQSYRSRFLKEVKKTVKGAIVLLPLLGITWIFGTVGYKSYAVSLIFVILNAVQGVAIFLIYCVFNAEIYRALQRRLAMLCVGRKKILRRRSLSSAGSVKSAFNKSILKNLTRRSTLTPVYIRSNTPV